MRRINSVAGSRRKSPTNWRSQVSTGRRSDASARQQPPQQRGWDQFAAPPDAINIPRRGILYCSQLAATEEAQNQEEEVGHLDRLCLIRFPPDVADILRQRLAHEMDLQFTAAGGNNESRNDASDCASAVGSSSGCNASKASRGGGSASGAAAPATTNNNNTTTTGGSLGLTIVPSTVEDFRRFEIYFEETLGEAESAKKYLGVLVELPALLEVYKSLESELVFKSGDISQMIYVYDPSDNSANEKIQKIKNQQFWEWHSGLTPATHRIRARKFRNWRVFEKSDVAAAEKAICDAMRLCGTKQDTLSFEAATEETMELQLLSLGTGKLHDEPDVVSVIGPKNPIFKASLEGLTPNAVVAATNPNNPNNAGAEMLLRDVCANAEELRSMSVAEQLRFSLDPSGAHLDPSQLVPDNLEEVLFGELAQFPTEGARVDDVFSLEELGHLNQQSDSSSQASSLGTMSRRRKKKKNREATPSL